MATTYRGEDRRRENVAWEGPERRSRFARSAGGQLLEEGAEPSGPTGPVADDPNESTEVRNTSSIGTPGVDDRETREPDEADPDTGGTDDEGGASTLGGGIFEGQHRNGTTSGARGHEGLDFPGENTWGEEEAERERKE